MITWSLIRERRGLSVQSVRIMCSRSGEDLDFSHTCTYLFHIPIACDPESLACIPPSFFVSLWLYTASGKLWNAQLFSICIMQPFRIFFLFSKKRLQPFPRSCLSSKLCLSFAPPTRQFHRLCLHLFFDLPMLQTRKMPEAWEGEERKKKRKNQRQKLAYFLKIKKERYDIYQGKYHV